MKNLIFAILFLSAPTLASVVGISTHPLNEEARVLSAETTGYMSQRHEVGMGLRYTQEISQGQLLDLMASGAQESRGLTIGGGMDFQLLQEDVSQPRVSIKPYVQHQKFESEKLNYVGAAPTMRKGLSANGYEFFPYLALPTGLRIDNTNSEFDYYAALTFGASMPLPVEGGERLLVALEGSKNLGAASDYLGVNLSWVWK
jgi:hypothetical protein